MEKNGKQVSFGIWFVILFLMAAIMLVSGVSGFLYIMNVVGNL